MGYLKILGAGALAYSLSPPLLAFASVSCSVEALNALNVPGMTVTSATPVAAANGVQAYCRAVGTVTTKGEGAGVNEDGFDIDLPETWNGKFLFLGGGGFDGNPHAIHEASPQQLAKGYATSSTDSGHVPDNGTFAITAPGVPNKPALIDSTVHVMRLESPQSVSF